MGSAPPFAVYCTNGRSWPLANHRERLKRTLSGRSLPELRMAGLGAEADFQT